MTAPHPIAALIIAIEIASPAYACPSNTTPVRLPVPVFLAGQKNLQERYICAARAISVSAEKMRSSQGIVCRPDEHPVISSDGSLWYTGCAKTQGLKP